MPKRLQKAELLRALLFFIAAVSIFFATSLFLKREFHLEFLTRSGLEDIQIRLAAFGKWMPLVYCLCYGLRFLIYIPEPVLMMLAGFLVGPYYAVILVTAGSLLAASLGYGFARLLAILGAEKLLKFLLRKKYSEANGFARRHGFRTLLALRMMPVFPFSLMTYSAGLLRLPYGRFIVAMGLGVMVPAFYYGVFARLIVQFFTS